MIFSELYSVYYNTVAEILSRVTKGECSERELQRVITERAFGESVLTILPSLKSGKWQLLRENMTTPIEHKPTMPLTDLERRWLKAVSLDPRIRLFDVEIKGLDDVEPLFTPEDYRVYDKYGDGDNYGDEGYIKRFRVILSALKDGASIKLEMVKRDGRTVFVRCKPARLEYSEKDDKFRLMTSGCRFITTVNLSSIISCERYMGDKPVSDKRKETETETATLSIINERNALERVMLHFAHFEKRAERLGRKRYLVKIRYDREDESEMVIRILSFGPMVEVTEPEALRSLVIEKLKKQKNCGLK